MLLLSRAFLDDSRDQAFAQVALPECLHDVTRERWRVGIASKSRSGDIRCNTGFERAAFSQCSAGDVRRRFSTRASVFFSRIVCTRKPAIEGGVCQWRLNASQQEKGEHNHLLARVGAFCHKLRRSAKSGQGIGLPVYVGAARAPHPVRARFFMVGRVARPFGVAVAYSGKTNRGTSGHPHWSAEPVVSVGNRP